MIIAKMVLVNWKEGVMVLMVLVVTDTKTETDSLVVVMIGGDIPTCLGSPTGAGRGTPTTRCTDYRT